MTTCKICGLLLVMLGVCARTILSGPGLSHPLGDFALAAVALGVVLSADSRRMFALGLVVCVSVLLMTTLGLYGLK